MQKLTVSSSPHLRHPDTTAGIMGDVIIALAPAAVFGCIIFGIKALLVLLTCIITAVLCEFLWNKALKKSNTIFDFSAVVTGLLLGMNLSSETPLWIAAIGSGVAIIIVKQFFGGLGHNFANPAITARIVLLVSFPAAMSVYSNPVSSILTSATPLAAQPGDYTLKMLFFGMQKGCIGEVSAFLLLVGGVYLLIRRVISPIIPVAFIGSVALLTVLSGGNALYAIFSGGLMIGAIFMATDYSTSPATPIGQLIFGLGCGIITFLIRQFGALPEGVSYAILLMNIITPHINRFCVPKPFGFVKEKGVAENG